MEEVGRVDNTVQPALMPHMTRGAHRVWAAAASRKVEFAVLGVAFCIHSHVACTWTEKRQL